MLCVKIFLLKKFKNSQTYSHGVSFSSFITTIVPMDDNFETKKFPIPSSAIDISVYKASCITLHRIFFLHICPLPNCIQKSRLISIPRRHLRIQMLNNLLSVLWQDSADRNQIIWVTSEENAVIYL